MRNGIILRGETTQGKAHDAAFKPATQFEFPQYQLGNGNPIDSAFKGITVEKPATDSNLGLVNIAINCGHVYFADDEAHAVGSNRFIVGCTLRNTAVADAAIPDAKIGQKTSQRFTARHHAAIDVKAEANILIANNRLPKSGEANFTMDGYIILDRKNQKTSVDGIVFDYDNRPGMYIKHYSLGGSGGEGINGTPETHPYGFRKGIIIRDNAIYNTGRMAIGFTGDGTVCDNNVIEFENDVWRPTVTGQKLTSGSSTNDNRAIEMRGWRWKVTNNRYKVYRNWAYDHSYKINDGEGLMHEDHVNSTIKDSILTGNSGNTYLSLYKCSGIDGLVIEDNKIDIDSKENSIGMAIYVNADRNTGSAPCKNVTIRNNIVSGGGILIQGSPASGNIVSGNECKGTPTTLQNKANAKLSNNRGFTKK